MDGQVGFTHAMVILICSDGVSYSGSPLEFLDLFDVARNKYSEADLPYTLIVPSLPGYGFSSGPSNKVMGTCESIAYVMDQLMIGLGFADRYIAQGGDLGESSTCRLQVI